MRDLKVIFPENANPTFQEEVHKAMITSLDMGGVMIMKTDQLVELLLKKSKARITPTPTKQRHRREC